MADVGNTLFFWGQQGFVGRVMDPFCPAPERERAASSPTGPLHSMETLFFSAVDSNMARSWESDCTSCGERA